MNESLIVQGLTLERAHKALLSNVSFSLVPGECVGLIGPNGAGKSSLLRVIAGLSTPTSGSLTGSALRSTDRQSRAQHLGFLPQQEKPTWNVSVRDLVALGRLPWRSHAGAQDDETHIDHAISQMELTELQHQSLQGLSGGELQRVLLARVLAGTPSLLLLDEPLTALDPYYQLHTMSVLSQLASAGRTLLCTIHDLNLAARYCSRLLLLHQGRLVADGTPEDVLTETNLAAVYGVSAQIHATEHGVVVIPRERLR